MGVKRIDEFPVASGITNDDLILVLDDPSGSSVTKNVAVSDLLDLIGIKSDPTGIPGATSIKNIVKISQTDYDNLSAIDPDTLYIIS
jgi:hypothetical protein